MTPTMHAVLPSAPRVASTHGGRRPERRICPRGVKSAHIGPLARVTDPDGQARRAVTGRYSRLHRSGVRAGRAGRLDRGPIERGLAGRVVGETPVRRPR